MCTCYLFISCEHRPWKENSFGNIGAKLIVRLTLWQKESNEKKTRTFNYDAMQSRRKKIHRCFLYLCFSAEWFFFLLLFCVLSTHWCAQHFSIIFIALFSVCTHSTCLTIGKIKRLNLKWFEFCFFFFRFEKKTELSQNEEKQQKVK